MKTQTATGQIENISKRDIYRLVLKTPTGNVIQNYQPKKKRSISTAFVLSIRRQRIKLNGT